MILDLALQALNITLMLSVGLELDPAEMRRALARPGLLVAVTMANFVLVPMVALGVGSTLPLSGAVLTALVLAAVAPGGGTGTLLTRAGKGNLELSVVLLGILTALAVPFVPLLAVTLMPEHDLTVGPLLRTLVLFQLLPLLAGMATRAVSTDHAALLNRLARPVSNLIFAALVVGLLVTRGQHLFDVGPAGLAAMVAVVLVSLAAPFAIAAPPRDRAAISLTSGVRNISLALLLSSTFFDDATTLAILVYALVMYVLALPLTLWSRRAG